MIVACPECGAKYRIDATRLRGGKGHLRCARCPKVFPVTAPAGTDESGEAERRQAALSAARRGGAAGGLDVAVTALPAGSFRQLVVGCLARCGARSVAVDDGPGALEVVRRSRPKLLVTAFWLRGLTGPELAASVRADPETATTRILLVGGPPVAGRHAPNPARVHGVDAHLPDGAAPADLDDVLRLLLERAPGTGHLAEGEAVREFARLALADACLYQGAELDAALRESRDGPTIDELKRRVRESALERFPGPGAARRRALVQAVEAEIGSVLDARRDALLAG